MRAPLAAALERGARKVSDAIAELRVDFVYPREWQRAEPSKLILDSMNAPGDYERARKWWAATRPNENVNARSTEA